MVQILVDHPWIIAIILLWSLPWKGVALWRSARRGHKGWFLALLILNTLAILDILYIFAFSGKDDDGGGQQQSETQPISTTNPAKRPTFV